MKLARVVAVLIALTLAGCGVAEQDAPKTTAPTSGEPAAAFPVEIDHKYGTTTIPEKPTRVVTLGLSDQDAVLAHGVVPVGAIDWFKERPYGLWPWTRDRWGTKTPEIVGERDDFNLEKILNLKPDLILALYSGMTREQYVELSKIAPTVGQPKGFDDYGAPWQDMTRLAGKALGLADETDTMISDIDAEFADQRGRLSTWQGKGVAVVDPYEPGKYAVFQETDPKAAFMTELGFEVPDAINEAAKGNNAADLSSERLDMVDTDLVVVLANDPVAARAQLAADPVFAGLEATRENRVLYVPYATPAVGAALSFNTVLSIPYALREFVPLLDKA
jgi:iron-siderophore transport system substrate-binding protein